MCSDKAREGDHIVYFSDPRKMQEHYPNWRTPPGFEYDLPGDLQELAATGCRLGDPILKH
jgi:hypothetical protein